MLGPFLANYFISFLNWYRFEKSNKTLVWALFNLYPIYGRYLKYHTMIMKLKTIKCM